MASTNVLEALQAEIEASMPATVSHRATNVLAYVLEHREQFQAFSVNMDELRLVTEEIEAKYAEQMRFSRFRAFRDLAEPEQAPWKALARRYYSNVSETPEIFAENLYDEHDAELPSDPSVPGAWGVSVDEYRRPRECVEWYPPGKLPAHRAALLVDRFVSFPVPRCVVARELTPSAVQADAGRFWQTHLVLHEGRLVPPTVLAREAWQRGEDPGSRFLDRWFEDPRVCYLVEVYHCEEFDGPRWDFVGHALMTGEQLARYLNALTGFPRKDQIPRYQRVIESFGGKLKE